MGHDTKKLEKLIDKIMAEDTLAQPSFDFTKKLMSKVEAISNSTATVYKPLISKQVWMLIAISILALVGYFVFKEPTSGASWFARINLSQIAINPFENININFSKVMMYAIVLLAVMVGVQVTLLKHYFNKRMMF